eukprot:CAMPEP_0167740674 /NCGR_PEP_ID=MMETSP0110_2-20121227/417_1 /TAXON_ID=629695 /ORGANISM="Gymnochlora sp., Strain CCMP2014" /LENGTH=751 /DNA_ID=CAMNT_0007624611 /DNA_START=30 /DNA_END=2285 /DNA_ORIENTATION=-
MLIVLTQPGSQKLSMHSVFLHSLPGVKDFNPNKLPCIRIENGPREILRTFDNLMERNLTFYQEDLMKIGYRLLYYLDASELEQVGVAKALEGSRVVVNITVPPVVLRAAQLFMYDCVRTPRIPGGGLTTCRSPKNTTLAKEQIAQLEEFLGSHSAVAKTIFLKSIMVMINYVLQVRFDEEENVLINEESELLSAPFTYKNAVRRIASALPINNESFTFTIRCKVQKAIEWNKDLFCQIKPPPRPLSAQTTNQLVEMEADCLLHQLMLMFGKSRQVRGRGVKYQDDIVLATRQGRVKDNDEGKWKVTNVTWTKKFKLVNGRLVSVPDPIVGAQINELRYALKDGKEQTMKVLRISTLQKTKRVERILDILRGASAFNVSKKVTTLKEARLSIIESLKMRYKERRRQELQEWYENELSRLTSFAEVHDTYIDHHASSCYAQLILEHRERMWEQGDQVVISGLTNRPEFNGVLGALTSYDPLSNRYSVRTTVRDMGYDLKPCNLVHLNFRRGYSGLQRSLDTSDDWLYIDQSPSELRRRAVFRKQNAEELKKSARVALATSMLISQEKLHISSDRISQEVAKESKRRERLRLRNDGLEREVRGKMEMDRAITFLRGYFRDRALARREEKKRREEEIARQKAENKLSASSSNEISSEKSKGKTVLTQPKPMARPTTDIGSSMSDFSKPNGNGGRRTEIIGKLLQESKTSDNNNLVDLNALIQKIQALNAEKAKRRSLRRHSNVNARVQVGEPAGF